MKYKVIFTARARRAIDEYIEYIACEKQEPINAGRVLGAIDEAIDSLDSMPQRCPKAPEDAAVKFTIRMLLVKKTLVVLYRVDEEAEIVEVIGFRHGSQLPLHFD